MSFDFATVTTPFRMQPGLRRLAPGTSQLTPSTTGGRALREKLAVLASYADQALLRAPGFDPAPALQALVEHAARECPGAIHLDSDGRIDAPLIGCALQRDEVIRLDDGAPEVAACVAALPTEWRQAALLALAFVEDFAILDGSTARIPWLAVCLPSNWAPEEKVGAHFAQVHAPVADNKLLVTAADHLARLVTGTDRWERFVWTISRHPRLHAHPARVDPAPWPADMDADALATRAYFRTEHQTFIPVPHLQQAIFTIRVELQPLATALADPFHARQVHDALSTMSLAVLDYRGLTAARERLLVWLAARAA